MGLTIHYRGHLKSPDLINRVCFELEELSKIMDWSYSLLDEDLDQPCTASLEHRPDGGAEITGDLPLKGLCIAFGAEVSASFLFDVNGRLQDPLNLALGGDDGWDHVKTQFGTPDIHMTIVKLLHYLNDKFFAELEVGEEGEYWESGDEARLRQRFGKLGKCIDAMANALAQIPAPEEGDEEGLIKTIEDAFKRVADEQSE